MKLRKELREISAMLDKGIEILCSLLLFVMMIAVTLQIVSRYVFPTPLSWTEELSRFCMIWMAFLGASSLMHTSENTSVTFLLEKLSPPFHLAFDLFVKALMFALMAGLLYLSATELPKYTLGEKSAAMMISMLIPKSSIIFGSLFIILQLLWAIVDTVLKHKEEQA